MFKREIDAILAHLRKVLRSPKLQSEHCEALRLSIKEFKQIQRSGKLDKGKIFRATARLALTLQDVSTSEAEPERSTSKAE